MGRIRRCSDQDLTAILAIISAAAEAYRGVIPADSWHEPYMSEGELEREVAAGVAFWGYEVQDRLLGVIGMQTVRDVDLVRHAYVLPSAQRQGIGTRLLEHVQRLATRRLLVGTWASAGWAISFYESRGFGLASPDETRALLAAYWTIPDRQAETSVVLSRPPL
jgi:GNAT superfamily N-acetyltransferase